MTLRQLRAFVEVVRCAGFTAAARKLHLTQSATSLLVRELADDLVNIQGREGAVADQGLPVHD
ncbi:MAG: LysR family transcriptional regulator, partial [Pigmentiphaga sp.]|nr:LysR family transcriptional regulator [Pigmentiphaga sp.]